MTNHIFPFVQFGACDDQLKIINCAANLHKLWDDQDSSDAFTTCYSFGYVIRHRVYIVRNDNTLIFRSPCEYHWIGGLT